MFKIHFKNSTPYTSKQRVMMTNEGSESTRDNFGKFIYQFPPETKTLVRKLERILNKLYRQNWYLSSFELSTVFDGEVPNPIVKKSPTLIPSNRPH